MSSTLDNDHERVLFGQETDDEDEDNKADHEVDDPDSDNEEEKEDEKEDDVDEEPKQKKPKLEPNKRILKLIEQSRKTGDMIRNVHNTSKESYNGLKKSEKNTKKRPETVKRPKLFMPPKTNFCSEPILVKLDDLKNRKPEKGREYKIKRDIGVKQTRFLPFFMKASVDIEEFYRTPTDLACIWCTETFDDPPIPLAYSYSRSRDAFVVGGQYCSFQCMLAQAKRLGRRPVCCHMMKSVYKIPFAKTSMYNEAPCNLLLKKFGGAMTTEQFRATSEMVDVKHRRIQLPFIPLSAGMEEVQHMTSTIYDYGDEEKVLRVVSATITQSRPIPVDNLVPNKVQRTKFAQMPTLQEQISQSERKLRLQRKPDDVKKKKRTLRDFMSISSKQ